MEPGSYTVAFIYIIIHLLNGYVPSLVVLDYLLVIYICYAGPYELLQNIVKWYEEVLQHFLFVYPQDLGISVNKSDIPTEGITWTGVKAKLVEFDVPIPTFWTAMFYNRRRQTFITKIRYAICDRVVPIITNRYEEYQRNLHIMYPGGTDLPKGNIYSNKNHGNIYVSIDMREANWTILSYIVPVLLEVHDISMNVQGWIEFAKQFTDEDLFLKSKYLREIAIGGSSKDIAKEERDKIGFSSKKLINTVNEQTQKIISMYIARMIKNKFTESIWLDDVYQIRLRGVALNGDELIYEIEEFDTHSNIWQTPLQEHMEIIMSKYLPGITDILTKNVPLLGINNFKINVYHLEHRILTPDEEIKTNEQAYVCHLLDSTGKDTGNISVKGCNARVKRKVLRENLKKK